MATENTERKFLSLDGLQEYDSLIKQEIVDAVSTKADASHSHTDVHYTKSEVDSKISAVNTSITNITNGSVTVKEAEHATSADEAGSANTANFATKATQDASGNVITSTYETKTDATAKLAEAKSYTDSKTSGLASTTVVDNKITAHNTSTTAHSDIRELITDLTTKVNNFLDVDDETKDQLSEIIELIDSNKSTLDSITSGKVNVSDIVDNLTTSSSSKVLSANQGVVLKGLIDALEEVVNGKAAASHTHTISNITNLQTTLDGKADTSHTHTVSQISDLTATAKELNYMDGVTSNVQTQLDSKAASSHSHSISDVTNLQSALDAKAAQTSLDTHTSNTTVHITSTERTNWGAAYTHSQAAHAPSNAEKNQNAFSNVKVGTTTISADTTTDTLTLEGSNVTITPDTTNDKITIAVASGSTSVKGIVQLTDSVSSTSTTTAATPNSVKSAYDLANTAKTAADEAKDIADGKADASHSHAIADVTGLQSALDGKAAASHGTHVTYSTTAPVMDGTASVGTAATVARSDHKHPTDTSRASQADLDALAEVVDGKAASSHTHTIANITNLQTTLNNKAAASHTHTVADISDLTATATELNYMDGVTSGVQAQLDSKAASSHSHTITASASDDDVVVLTGTNGSNKVTYSASHAKSGVTAGTYKSVTVNEYGHVTAGTNPTTISGYGITDAYTKTQVDTALSGKAASGHTHSAATTSAAGFMSAADKTKLDGIATGATAVTVDTALSTTSTNPVQNKVVNSAISTLTSTVSANTSSINSHTTAIQNLQTAVGEIQEITSAEISALFA